MAALRDDVNGDNVRFYGGGALTIPEARAVASRTEAIVAVLAGPTGSGKTTLLAETYEGFLRGTLRSRFVGSLSLLGFEERCFLSRVASGRASPVTERTNYDDASLLHLTARKDGTSQPTQLLLADLPGEVFERIRDGIEEPAHTPILRRADHVMLLLDGGKLVDVAGRHSVYPSIAALQRTLVESKQLAPWVRFHLVMTKWDLVLSAGKEPTAFAETVLLRLVGTSRTLGVDPLTHLTAARPQSADLEPGFGVQGLLDAWHIPPTRTDPEIQPPAYETARNFNRLREAGRE